MCATLTDTVAPRLGVELRREVVAGAPCAVVQGELGAAVSVLGTEDALTLGILIELRIGAGRTYPWSRQGVQLAGHSSGVQLAGYNTHVELMVHGVYS